MASPRLNGAFDADDVMLSNVSGDESEALIIYADSSDPSTLRSILKLAARQ